MLHEDIDYVLYSEETLAETVKKLGAQISEDYEVIHRGQSIPAHPLVYRLWRTKSKNGLNILVSKTVTIS